MEFLSNSKNKHVAEIDFHGDATDELYELI